jgi:lipopolysaccharide/colanic/teichoic acid biosynthesis glycosyltransferase
MTRRLFDIAVAALALIVAAVPLLLVAFAITLFTGRPVLFRARRIGQQGRPFVMYKLRTMRTDAPGSAVTADGDPRVTSVGAVLRRWRIDELPQFWNVLRGDMTLVGPRPEVEQFVRLYSPADRRILSAKPGLASMSQLVYADEPTLLRDQPDPEVFYGREMLQRKVAVDLDYELHRTMLTDLRLLKRLALMVLRRGARTGAA